MNEIRTIYDNTFVLGQTSATNFVGGPGISITQPSEGTVRIANDETVLWSSDVGLSVTNRTDSANLSESVYNFERIRVYDDWLTNLPTQCTEFDTQSQSMNRFGTFHASIDSYNFNSNPAFYVAANYYSLHNDGTLLRTERNFIASMKNNAATTAVERNAAKLFKIVGINRISGGNA